MDTLTIIIPTYRRPVELKRALSSIEAQHCLSNELTVIVVNDDLEEPPKSLEGLFPKLSLKVINNFRSKGACGARNSGILTSKSQYICFLDDDDEWLPEKLSTQLSDIKYLEQGHGLLGTGFYTFDGKSKTQEPEGMSGMVFDELLGKTASRAPKLSTVMIPREILIEVGMFDEQLLSRQDLDLYIRIAKKYPFYHNPNLLVISHKEGADRITKNPHKKIQGYRHMLEKYAQDLAVRPQAQKKYYLDYARALIRGGEFSASLQMTIKSYQNKILQGLIVYFLKILPLYFKEQLKKIMVRLS